MQRLVTSSFTHIAGALLLLLLGVLALAGCSAASLGAQVEATPTTDGSLPPVEETEIALNIPPSQTPVPWPTPGPEQRPPDGQILSDTPLKGTNISWGVQNSDGLEIWAGRYDDKAGLSIVAAQLLLSWNVPLTLVDMAASPNGQSLAVIARLRFGESDEGFPSTTFLYVVDLATSNVRSVPDYDKHYDLFAGYNGDPSEYIVGWLDNDRFAVQQIGSFMPMVVGKDGASYSKVNAPNQQYPSVQKTAISPDGKTFFSQLVGENAGLWLYDADGSGKRKLSAIKDLWNPVWSPDGRYIAYVAPQILDSAEKPVDYSQSKVWLLDVQTGVQQEISTKDSWDIAPAWSPDSSRLAFLRATAATPPNGEYRLDALKTSVYLASIKDRKAYPLANAMSGFNSKVVWTESGEIVVLAKDAASSGNLNMRVASSNEKLSVKSSTGGSIADLTIFK